MAPRRGLDFHVCQSSSIPARGDHKYTFMPPGEMLKEAVCPSPVWTRMAIFLIDDNGKSLEDAPETFPISFVWEFYI